MATKKVKRFNDGGISEEQLKAEGLAASKDDKVGFFERLRMGNIDAPDSEAYRRYGAGRGRAARAPVTNQVYDIGYEGRDAAPSVANVAEAPFKLSDPYEIRDDSGALSTLRRNEYGEMYDPTGSSAASPAKKTVTKTSAKTTKSKPVYDYGDEGRGKPATKPLVNQIPTDKATAVSGERTEPMSDAERYITNALAVTGGGAGVAGLYRLGKNMLNARKAAKVAAQKRANLKRDVEEGIDRNLLDEFQEMASSAAKRTSGSTRPTEASRSLNAGRSVQKSPANKTKRFDDESNIEFKRGGAVKKTVKKMASGGSTSSASSRGDGIAQRGKTRGKIY